jgi:hypothetical protein
LLNLDTYCNKKVVKDGRIILSAYPFKWSLITAILNTAGNVIKFAIILNTCWSGEISDDAEAVAYKLRIVSTILFDYWFMNIMLALSCIPNTIGSSWLGSV